MMLAGRAVQIAFFIYAHWDNHQMKHSGPADQMVLESTAHKAAKDEACPES